MKALMSLTGAVYASALLLGNFITPANAHGAAFSIPLHHSLLTASHPRNLMFTRIPGLSGATSTFYEETKYVTGRGVVSGIVAQVNSGNIGTGSLTGTFSEYFYGFPSANQTIPGYFALGDNPINSANAPSTFTPPLASFFTVGKLPGKGFIIKPSYLTGAQRIVQNQLNYIVGNAVNTGRNVANTGLTGGGLSGAYYQNLGGTDYAGIASTYLAFGNNPLNTGIFQRLPNPPIGPNYLSFLNKLNFPVTNGQIAGVVYAGLSRNTPLFNNGYFILAGGSNPLFMTQQPTSVFINYIAPYAVPSFFRLKF